MNYENDDLDDTTDTAGYLGLVSNTTLSDIRDSIDRIRKDRDYFLHVASSMIDSLESLNLLDGIILKLQRYGRIRGIAQKLMKTSKNIDVMRSDMKHIYIISNQLLNKKSDLDGGSYASYLAKMVKELRDKVMGVHSQYNDMVNEIKENNKDISFKTAYDDASRKEMLFPDRLHKGDILINVFTGNKNQIPNEKSSWRLSLDLGSRMVHAAVFIGRGIFGESLIIHSSNDMVVKDALNEDDSCYWIVFRPEASLLSNPFKYHSFGSLISGMSVETNTKIAKMISVLKRIVRLKPKYSYKDAVRIYEKIKHKRAPEFLDLEKVKITNEKSSDRYLCSSIIDLAFKSAGIPLTNKFNHLDVTPIDIANSHAVRYAGILYFRYDPRINDMQFVKKRIIYTNKLLDEIKMGNAA